MDKVAFNPIPKKASLYQLALSTWITFEKLAIYTIMLQILKSFALNSMQKVIEKRDATLEKSVWSREMDLSSKTEKKVSEWSILIRGYYFRQTKAIIKWDQ